MIEKGTRWRNWGRSVESHPQYIARPTTVEQVVDVLAFANEDGIGVGWSGDVAWILVPLVIIAVAVLVGARCWRALPRSRD